MFLDIDGTVQTPEKPIDDRDRAAVTKLRAAKVKVYVNTGRSVPGACRARDALGADSLVFAFNGAVVHDQDAGRDLVRLSLGPTSVQRSLDLAEHHGMGVFCFRDRKIYSHQPEHAEHRDILERMQSVGVKLLDRRSDLPREQLQKLWLLGPSSAADELISASTGPACRWVRPSVLRVFGRPDGSLTFLAATPVPHLKRESLAYVQRTLGIPFEAMVAVGDDENDIEAVQAAGLGVAVSSALPALKARADQIIGAPEAGAVADLLEALAETATGP